jgi:drug/metabolite transporter (DMT)-like permease
VAYIAVFSLLILNEPVSKPRWAAAALGMAGALLIAKPAFADWDCAYLIVLLGTGLNGLSFVLNRFLQRRDGEATTMFYTSAVLVLGNLPGLLIAPLPAPEIFFWLPGLLLFGPLGTYVGIVAVRYASTAALGPYTLLRLLIGILGAILMFQEVPDLLSTAGAMLIVAGCLLSSCTMRVPECLPRWAIKFGRASAYGGLAKRPDHTVIPSVTAHP